MRLLFFLILFGSPAAFAQTDLSPSLSTPRYCDRAIARGGLDPLALANLFDFTEAKSMRVLPGVRAESLEELFNLEPAKMDLSRLALATSWMRGLSPAPKAELYLAAAPKARRVSLLNLDLDGLAIHRWGSGSEGPGTELGWLLGDKKYEHFHRPFLNVRVLGGKYVEFTLGLDLNCERIRMYIDRPENSSRILTESGFLCRVPMLSGSATLLKGFSRRRQ